MSKLLILIGAACYPLRDLFRFFDLYGPLKFRKRPINFLHLYSEEPYNPIPAFVHLCHRLFVTGDSTAMLSECVTAGSAAVDVLLVSNKTEAKQHRFVQRLAKGGTVTVFGETDSLSREKVDLSQVAVAVQERLTKPPPRR